MFATPSGHHGDLSVAILTANILQVLIHVISSVGHTNIWTVGRLSSVWQPPRLLQTRNLAQQEGTQRAQTSAEHGNPEDPDFGLWTPGSEV